MANQLQALYQAAPAQTNPTALQPVMVPPTRSRAPSGLSAAFEGQAARRQQAYEPSPAYLKSVKYDVRR
jgi:hypothetical protein